MNHTLLIWEEVPEQITLYLLPSSVEKTFREVLEKSHNHFVNEEGWEMNQGLNKLNDLIYGNDEVSAEGEFSTYKLDNQNPLIMVPSCSITRVYRSGYLL